MHYAGRFPYTKLIKYPHLAREDVITWERFIDGHPDAYTSVEYDFALGKVETHKELAKALDIAGAERVNRFRADIIGYRDSEIHIIECKKRATPSVLGQVLADIDLFIRDYAPTIPVKPVVIARETAPEMDFLAASRGVYLIFV